MDGTNNMCAYFFGKGVNNFLFIFNISAIADNIISTVKYTVEDQTGLEVENVNIFVDGVRVDN